jgi:hypothetical protein
MRTWLPVVVVAVAVLLSGTLRAQTEPPWFGTWELDPRSGDAGRPSPYRRVTLAIGSWEDGLKVVYDMVGTRGGTTHLEWTGAIDGRDYPVQGVDYVLTNTYSPVDDRGYQILVKVDGSPAATTRVSVSLDGRHLTAVTTETDEGGRTRTSTAVYDRR